MNNGFLEGAVLAASVVFVVFLFLTATNVPEVHVSYSTKQCEKVVPAEAGTCEQLPKKYSQVWVR